MLNSSQSTIQPFINNSQVQRKKHFSFRWFFQLCFPINDIQEQIQQQPVNNIIDSSQRQKNFTQRQSASKSHNKSFNSINNSSSKNINNNISITTQNQYPTNEIFFLTYNQHVIIAKISQKFFRYPHQIQDGKHQLPSNSFTQGLQDYDKYNSFKINNSFEGNHSNLFSLIDQGVKLDSNSWQIVTPEKMAKYIALRCRNFNVVLDAFCGVGGTSIQFAKTCDFVLAIDIDRQRCQYTKHNSMVYQVNNKIEVINENFYNLKNVNADMVFLNPDYEFPKKDRKFSIFTNIKPDITKCLQKALSISKNVVILFPKFVEIEEIAQLFSEQLKGLKQQRYSLEIENIFVNHKIDKIVVYFGEASQISKEDEIQFIIDYFTCYKFNKYQQQNNSQFLQESIKIHGIQKICEIVWELEREVIVIKENLFKLFQQQLQKFTIEPNRQSELQEEKLYKSNSLQNQMSLKTYVDINTQTQNNKLGSSIDVQDNKLVYSQSSNNFYNLQFGYQYDLMSSGKKDGSKQKSKVISSSQNGNIFRESLLEQIDVKNSIASKFKNKFQAQDYQSEHDDSSDLSFSNYSKDYLQSPKEYYQQIKFHSANKDFEDQTITYGINFQQIPNSFNVNETQFKK